jgi:hypothetical protein
MSIKVYCERCGREIFCNGILGRKIGCDLSNLKTRIRSQDGNLTGYLPFQDTKTNNFFCVCFECWKKHKTLSDEQMFGIDCWKGLKREWGNPSHRRGKI